MRNKKRAAALLFAAMLLTGSIPVYGAQPEENGIISSEAAVEYHEQIQNAAAGEKDGEATYASYLNIEETWMELAAGTQSQLQVHTDAPEGTVTYRSADPKIATVDKNGVIRAVSGGNSGSAETDIIVSSGKLSAECTVSVYNTIALSEEDVVLYTKGSNTKQLKAVCSPLGNVTWRSSQPGVAIVSEAGKITAKRAGSTTITATANGVSAECYVTVRKPSVELVSRATVYLKNPQKLDITVQPAAKVKWKSLNTKIATVNTKGVITAKKTGKVTITATANGITKKCRVTVAKPSVTLWNSEVAVFEGSTVSLNADARPAGAVRWKTSNKKTATVDKNGVITGRRAGKVKITAYVGGASATATVRVFKNPYQLNMTKRTLAVGQSASLYVKNLDSGISPSFEGNGQAVSLNAKQGSCRIKATEKGKSTVEVRFQVYQDGCWASWSISTPPAP